MTTPSTKVSRLSELQSESRSRLDELLDSTPLATVALVRDGHPVVFPTAFARVDDDLVIHGSTGSPWMRALAAGRLSGRGRHRVGRNHVGTQRIRVLVPLSQRRCVRSLRAGARCRQGALPGAVDRVVRPRADLRAARQHPQGTRGHIAAAAAHSRGQLVAQGQRRLARGSRRGHRRRRLGRCRPDVGDLRCTVARARPQSGHPGARVGAWQ